MSVFVCMCVYVCVCVLYICVYVCVYMRVYICVYVCVSLCVYVYESVYVCCVYMTQVTSKVDDRSSLDHVFNTLSSCLYIQEIEKEIT